MKDDLCSRMIRLCGQKPCEYPSAGWLRYASAFWLKGYEYRSDLRQKLSISYPQQPSAIRFTIDMKTAKAHHFLRGPRFLAPDIKRPCCGNLARISEVIGVEVELFSFGVENSSKCSLRLAVLIGVSHIEHMKVPSHNHVLSICEHGALPLLLS